MGIIRGICVVSIVVSVLNMHVLSAMSIHKIEQHRIADPPSVSDSLSHISVTTQHNDYLRSGANLYETALNTHNVSWGSFGLLHEWRVQGKVFAQPLYVPHVTIPGIGVRNVVYVATDSGNIYAFDADGGSAGVALWPTSTPDQPHNVAPGHVLALYSTPVIDTAQGTMYVVYVEGTAFSTGKGSGCSYDPHNHITLAAIDIATGHVQRRIRVEGYSASGVALEGAHEFARAGLLLLHGIVYVALGALGSIEDCDVHPHQTAYTYRGWVIGYDSKTFRQTAIFCTTPIRYPHGLQYGGGIWQSGNGPASDGNTSIFINTGNGMYKDPNQPSRRYDPPVQPPPDSYADSIVKLSIRPGVTAANALVPTAFTPRDYQLLERTDLDLGSSGPVVLPSGKLLSGGKEGVYYVLRTESMKAIQGFQAFTNTWNAQWRHDILTHQAFDYGADYDIWQRAPNIHGSPVYWKGPQGIWVYAWSEKDYLKAYKYDPANQTAPLDSAHPLRTIIRAPGGVSMPGGTLSISANGAAHGSGIVWATVQEPFLKCDDKGELADKPSEGKECDAVNYDVPGRFYAFDAEMLELLFEDRLVKLAKFVPPTIADGKVFLAMYDAPPSTSEVRVYGLLSAPSSPPDTNESFMRMDINGDGKDDLVTRDAYGYFAVRLSNGQGFVYSGGFKTRFTDAGGWSSGLRFFPMDIDGDGRGDLLVRDAFGSFEVWLSNGTQLTYSGGFKTRFTDAGGWNSGLRFFPMDIDGDGKDDLVTRDAFGSFEVWLSDGQRPIYQRGFSSRFTDVAGWNSGLRFF